MADGLDPARREELAAALGMPVAHSVVRDALAPLIARWLADAEQRGREDNADHGMCYVHGSKALEGLLTAERELGYAEGAAEVRARVEAVMAKRYPGGPWSNSGTFVNDLRAALADPDAHN